MSKIHFRLQCKFSVCPMPINVFWEFADVSSLAEAFLNMWRLVHATKDSHISSIFHQSLLAFIHHIFFKPTFLLANFLDPSFFGLLFSFPCIIFLRHFIFLEVLFLQISFCGNSMLFKFHFILILNISNSLSSIYNLWIGLSCHIMSCQKWYDECFRHNRVIHKVRKTKHQNPEFGHTQGEIQKKPAMQRSTLALEGGWNSENRQFW